jgi:hypothetical protein
MKKSAPTQRKLKKMIAKTINRRRKAIRAQANELGLWIAEDLFLFSGVGTDFQVLPVRLTFTKPVLMRRFGPAYHHDHCRQETP